jgi:hypothetical protein
MEDIVNQEKGLAFGELSMQLYVADQFISMPDLVSYFREEPV